MAGRGRPQRKMPPRRAHLALLALLGALLRPGCATSRELELGPGLSLHLDTLPARNASQAGLARHALRLTYNGIGMRLAASDDDQDYRIAVLYDEGRGRRHWNMMSEVIIPALLGYKTSALTFVLLFGMLAFVAKALTVASVAAVAAAALWLRKLFAGGLGDAKTAAASHSIADFDQHASGMHQVFAEYPGDIADLGYAQTAGGNYIAYGDPHAEAAAAASDPHYAYVETPLGAANYTLVQRRRASAVRKAPTYLTLRRKSAPQ